MNGMAERFRALLAANGPIILPGCFDVLSAMLIEEAGFPAVFLSGYGAAASAFGNPDIGLTSLSETVLIARNMVHAVSIPVVVDADNGYGNEDNVVRTVYEFELAGSAAMIMEDQVLPKKCGHTDNKVILPLELYMKKLRSALKARQTPMVIVARTDAMDISEAIKRAQIFHKEGADVTLVDGLRSLDDMKRVADEIPGHKQINLIYGGKTPILSNSELAKLGFKVILYSTPALFTAVKTLRHELKKLSEAQNLTSISDQSIPFKEFQKFVDDRYRRRPHVKNALDET